MKKEKKSKTIQKKSKKNKEYLCFLGCNFKKFESPHDWKEVFVLIFAGIFVGFLNGFLGTGGGILLVPILTFIVREPTKIAHATAVLIILPVCFASGIVYYLRGFVDLDLTWKVLIGTVAGGVLGTFLLKKLASNWISLIFAVVMIGVGVKIIFF